MGHHNLLHRNQAFIFDNGSDLESLQQIRGGSSMSSNHAPD